MWTRWLGTLALCTLTPGCQLASNAIHNVCYETRLNTAEVQERCDYEKLAKASWETVKSTEPCAEWSKDHEDGFIDGFVDYLQFGGPGQPPYVPPKRYWGPNYHTPEGYRAIEEWFAGFRHGVTAAEQSGYRRWSKVPSAHATESPPLPAAVPPEVGPAMPAPVTSNGPYPAQHPSTFKLGPPGGETDEGQVLPAPPAYNTPGVFRWRNELSPMPCTCLRGFNCFPSSACLWTQKRQVSSGATVSGRVRSARIHVGLGDPINRDHYQRAGIRSDPIYRVTGAAAANEQAQRNRATITWSLARQQSSPGWHALSAAKGVVFARAHALRCAQGVPPRR